MNAVNANITVVIGMPKVVVLLRRALGLGADDERLLYCPQAGETLLRLAPRIANILVPNVRIRDQVLAGLSIRNVAEAAGLGIMICVLPQPIDPPV